VITGGTRSLVQVIVLEVVAELPQPSTAVNILVCEDEQLDVTIAASVNVTVVVLHPSLAVADPSAASISEASGLQPRVVTVPVAVIVGGVRSLVQLTVLIAVAELPQPSEAMKVLTCEKAQPLEVTAPSVNVTIGVLQAAVAVAEPRAAVISAAEGLQPRVTEAGIIIMVGALGALSQLTVLEVVAELPQPSTAVNILVCEEEQLVVDTGPSLALTLTVLQASVAVAVPKAASICAAVGLQPRDVAVPVAVITGGTRSLVQLTVLEVVAELPQPSTAVNILVCKDEQEDVTIAASVNVTVVVLQPSLAVADPSAASMSEASGLQPRVVTVPVAVIVGGVRSLVQLTVLIAVAELPQPSEAMNVLTCEKAQPLEVTAPSVNVIIGVLHAAVAVADPRAAVISAAEGLQPRVTEAGIIIMVGALGALSQLTVLEVVAELPQPSTAVNILVCEDEQLVVDTDPSLALTLTVLQASVAVAVPKAASICAAVGLQPSDVAVPVAVITGGTRSLVQVIVLEVVAVLPQPSTAVNILVCEDEQLDVTIAASVNVTVAVLQPSLAVADPSAASMSEASGLQPRVVTVPVAVMTGAVRSLVQLTVLIAVALLPQRQRQ
jgi:hypothetical protein